MLDQLVPQVRVLTADDLGIGVQAKAGATHTSSAPDAPDVSADNPTVQEIIRLAAIFGGVILSGPPGTSKSFFAAAAADALTGRVEARYRFVQFHASYQYEDFMLGFSPHETGFTFKKGPFLELVERADADRQNTYVLVIDELSRADVGRVFGEALTYVERSKRELWFTIADGRKVKVPSNFVILATMNPFDRGVDEVDAAFERRFAKMTLDPDANLLDDLLTDNDLDETLKARVGGWFKRINAHAQKNPAAAVGHAYFSAAADEASLRDLWDYQLQYVVRRAFKRDENTRADIESAWSRIFMSADATVTAQTPSPEGDS